MLLVTRFDIDADIIDVPQTIIEDAEYYQDQFLKWFYNKSVNTHTGLIKTARSMV